MTDEAVNNEIMLQWHPSRENTEKRGEKWVRLCKSGQYKAERGRELHILYFYPYF